MGSPTYKIKGLVLKRTKLGESDVICSILSERGSQIRAVAKGARKPSSSLSSRLEMFSSCELLLAKGKTLDIIKEARLLESNAQLRRNLSLTEAASPMVELLDRATLDSLDNDKLYPLTLKALGTVCLKHDNSSSALTITAAHLLKTISFLGFKPQLEECIGCGNTEELTQAIQSGKSVAFSYLDGGLVCTHCRSLFETQWVHPLVLHWAQVLLYSTFEQIETYQLDTDMQHSLLRFLQSWIKIHIGYSLKSLTYVFSYGLQD